MKRLFHQPNFIIIKILHIYIYAHNAKNKDWVKVQQNTDGGFICQAKLEITYIFFFIFFYDYQYKYMLF